MRYSVWMCVILSSCVPEIYTHEFNKISTIHVLGQPNFSWDVQELHTIIISAQNKPKLKDLKSRMVIMSDPEHEILKNISQEKNMIFNLKMSKKPGYYSLEINKKELRPGSYVGLYMKEDSGAQWELKYLFYISYPQAKLVSHDVTERVSKNRIIFSFKFDQAIKVLDDHAIKLRTESAQVPSISSIRVSPDAMTLVVRLEKDIKLIEEHNYSFVFDNLVNLDNKKIILEPINFIATETQEHLNIIKEASFDASSDSVEITWHLNNNYLSELYFGEDLSGDYNCLAQSCPRIASGVPSLKPDKSFMGKYFLTGLKACATYYYILRAEDYQGQILISSGVFKTRASQGLRFSEILINPHQKPQHKAEFIEFFYAGPEPKRMENLRLIFEGPENSSQACVIASPQNPVYVRPKEYVLIVGHDFDEVGAQVPHGAVIVRLAKKSLCGGLANEKPQSIKLVDEAGLVDRYGGYLWPTPKGASVLKRDFWGLDEFDNYCYSDAARGPTPGGPN